MELKWLSNKLHLAAIAACAFSVSACSDVTNTPGAQGSNNDEYGYVAVDEDPLEPLNRSFFATHNVIDKVIVRPAAQIYTGVVPEEGRDIISNILDNLAEPVTFVNSVLQGDAENSFATFWRFVLNSTLGVAGAFDFAEEVELTNRDADFGQTLATYGVNSGPYLFLPIFGPSTIRDGVGTGVDILFRPVTWVDGDTWSIVEGSANAVDFRAQNMRVLDDLYNNSIDPYATYRSAYLQRRAVEIREWTFEDAWEGNQ